MPMVKLHLWVTCHERHLLTSTWVLVRKNQSMCQIIIRLKTCPRQMAILAQLVETVYELM